jgi:hypothetical protein
LDEIELREDEGSELAYDEYDIALEGIGAAMEVMGESW